MDGITRLSRPLCLALLIVAIAATLSLGQACGDDTDWRDIAVLPTNGDAGRNIKITLSTEKKAVEPGEQIFLTFEADQDCHLTLMDMGTSGKIVRIWPNQYSNEDNFVKAGTPKRFPGPEDGFAFRIAGPEGVERIIAYATSEKGKILSENEFQGLRGTGFNQFVGGAKDLSTVFTRETNNSNSGLKWGTAQVNICIGKQEKPQTSVLVPRNVYVLAVGAPTGQLKFCKRDAQRFSDAMISKMGVTESNTRLVLGSDATYQGFVGGLEWLASKTQPEDSAVIYFSGHGSSIPDQPPLDEVDGRDECFVLYHVGDKIPDYKTAIRQKIIMVDDDFNRRLKTIPARKKIIVVDACHSGTMNKTVEQDDDGIVSK